MKIQPTLRSLAGPLCCALLSFPLIASPAVPGKGGLGVGGLGGFGGNDDIGSLPATAEDAPSFLLLGSASALSAALLDAAGPGEILAHRLGGDRVLLELEGSLHVRLDADALVSGHVSAWFHTGAGFGDALGVNHLRELPLSALASGASLQVQNREGQAYALGARATADGLLHVRQVLR